MSRAAFLSVLLLTAGATPRAASAQALPRSDECRSCHLQLQDDRLSAPARNYEGDVHAAAGFGCLACHGGARGLDNSKGFLAAPERREIPALCGSCHSDAVFMRQFNPNLPVDEEREYWTSVHGQRLQESNDTAVATCIDCHPAHGILPASDPESTVHPLNVPDTCGRCHSDPRRMALRGIPTDQLEKYKSSVHGHLLYDEGDVSAPVCNDCHGNHGAAPPGVGSVRNVCGQCHSVMADYFASSGHVKVFEDANLPGCVECHSNHAIHAVADSMLVYRSTTVCRSCHEEGDERGGEFLVIAQVLDSLDRVAAHSREVLEEAENLGMEVSQALFELDDVNNARTRARSAIHTFSSGPVRDEIKAGLTAADNAEESGEEALAEHKTRRVGLGVSAAIILMLILALTLKIRDLEERFEDLIRAFDAFYMRQFAEVLEGETSREQLRLAACALLLEATYADGRFTDDERAYVQRQIRLRFSLDEEQADELITLAEREREVPDSVGRLTKMIAENFNTVQKHNLVNELWVLVYADGELTKNEERFVKHVSSLLGIEESEVTAAGQPLRPEAEPPTEEPGDLP